MPRKPKLSMDLQIEGLSTGNVVRREAQLVDDFTGELIPEPEVVPKVVMTSADAQRRRSQAKQAAALDVLRKAGMIEDQSKLVPKGMRAGDQVLLRTASGLAFVFDNRGKPWRRF